MKLALLLASAGSCLAQSTISQVDHVLWSANAGWLDARPSATDGARIGEFFCAGWLYAANIGWINLGSGSPDNGAHYGNNTATDCGVNVSPDGALSGYAWAANAGWLNFAAIGNPRLDWKTGRLSGSVWGANLGWIALASAPWFTRTESLAPARDADGDGIPDPWELIAARNLTTLSDTGDFDQDGASDLSEYTAGTDPFAADSLLDILSFTKGDRGKFFIKWTSQISRCYLVECSTDLRPRSWTDCGAGLLAADGASTSLLFYGPDEARLFYRVRPVVPLAAP